MTRNHKIRLAFFIGIVLFLLICSAYYSAAFRNLFYSDQLFDSPDHVYVDGADVASVFQLMTSAANSFVLTLTSFFYVLFVVIGNIIFFLILRLAAIKKDSEVSGSEYRISLRVMLISTAVIFIVSVVITGFSFVLYNFSLFWQIPLFAFLLYLLPLKKRIQK